MLLGYRVNHKPGSEGWQWDATSGEAYNYQIGLHNVGWVFIQATVAILILVGFESCTSLGGEAVNPKRDTPIAVITSLLVQGAFCYLFEYFCANYSLNSGYLMGYAQASAAPLGE
jgi:APA family basic amino acid/polyamine antiporter